MDLLTWYNVVHRQLNMKKNPLVSIIIPVHNSEKYLVECLDSVINQEYDNLEIILVNDRSSDGSEGICKDYQNKDNRVKYVKADNGNAALTRRDGIKKSTADLICFIDSDDIVDPEYVKLLYLSMKDTKTSVSACNMDIFSKRPMFEKRTSKNQIGVTKSNADTFAEHYHMTEDNKLILQTLPCKLFEKQLFNDIDYSVLKTNIFEDNFIMVQILRKIENIGTIDEILYWYRQNSDSTSAKTVLTKVDYEGKRLNFTEFFRDVVMNYCRKMLPGDNVDAAIDKISAVEFFNYANMVPDQILHIEYLEEKIDLMERQLKAKEDQLENLKHQIKLIQNSKSYKFVKSATKPFYVTKNFFTNKK